MSNREPENKVHEHDLGKETDRAKESGATDQKRSTCAACPARRLLLLPRMVDAVLTEVLPVPVARHLRNARRETLLAARCVLDQMLEREEEPKEKTRRKIEIE